jgi:hypothetical protein
MIGAALALMTAITCTPASRKNVAAHLFALTSRSFLFALELGNTDELIFSLLVFGLFLIDQQRRALKSHLIGVLIAILMALKVYQVVASAIFVGRCNGLIKALLAVSGSVATLLLTSGHHLSVLLSNTPQDSANSFCAYPFFLAIIGPSPSLSSLTFLNHPVVSSSVEGNATKNASPSAQERERRSTRTVARSCCSCLLQDKPTLLIKT